MRTEREDHSQFPEYEVLREGSLNHAWSLSLLIIESQQITATSFLTEEVKTW